MKERFKKIMTGLGIVIFSVVGLWEYMQMYLYYDLPQIVVIMPICGCVAAVCLRKLSFVVPVTTILVCIVYQLVEKNVTIFQGFVINSKINTILNILPVILIFMFIGIAGGFLIRVLINRKKRLAVGILCCAVGVALTVATGIAMFGNPLYPFLARHAVNSYAERFNTDTYRVGEVSVFYSVDDLEYQGLVVMSDGVTYALYHDRATGNVYELDNGSESS